MGLEIRRLGPPQEDTHMDDYTVTERLCRTDDGRIVAEDHPDARWLYAIPGHTLPYAEAQAHGLVQDEAKATPPEGDKKKAKGADKARKPADTKAEDAGDDDPETVEAWLAAEAEHQASVEAAAQA